MEEEHAALINEVRYAERLCLRTARLYRHVQATTTFMTIVGGSAALASLSTSAPDWLKIAGGALMAAFGGAAIAMRPADKAAANEADAKRYARLRTDSANMSAFDLRSAIDKARETDVPEVELLRDVAWNDVMNEIGRPEEIVKLGTRQAIISSIA